MLKQYKNNTHSFFVASVCLLLAALNQAVAAEQEYNVEVLIIEDISDRYVKSENWPAIPEETVEMNKAGPESKAAVNDKRVRYLAKESFRMTDEAKRIEDSKEYKILLHTAWRQVGLDKSAAFPVHITSNTDSGSYIEGDFVFVMSRYLHISGDFTFYKTTSDGFVPYPIKFNRRMRSRETHYLDHPLIGVIVLATPIAR